MLPVSPGTYLAVEQLGSHGQGCHGAVGPDRAGTRPHHGDAGIGEIGSGAVGQRRARSQEQRGERVRRKCQYNVAGVGDDGAVLNGDPSAFQREDADAVGRCGQMGTRGRGHSVKHGRRHRHHHCAPVDRSTSIP